MKKTLINLLAAGAFCLVLGGMWTVAEYYLDQHEETVEQERETERYKKFIRVRNAPEEEDESTGEETVIVPDGALGVLYIPAFDGFEHLIALGVDRNTLNWYVGMYETYSSIGEAGNCMLAAHSNVLPGKQPYCFFNRIEEYLDAGDEVEVLWKDGNTYRYEVEAVYSWIDADDAFAYMDFDTQGRQYLTLQTCTHGDSDYRSFIRCIRIE